MQFGYFCVAAGVACFTPLGCGGKTQNKVMHGSVTYGGEKAPMGQVIFVPIDNTSQPPAPRQSWTANTVWMRAAACRLENTAFASMPARRRAAK